MSYIEWIILNAERIENTINFDILKSLCHVLRKARPKTNNVLLMIQLQIWLEGRESSSEIAHKWVMNKDFISFANTKIVN